MPRIKRGVIRGSTNSTMKSFPMAAIMARIMYIVRRKGIRLAVMVMCDVEEVVMCPNLDL